MADLPTVVEDTLDRLQALQSRAESACDTVQKSSGLAREWNEKTQNAWREVGPKGDALIQRISQVGQQLDGTSDTLNKQLGSADRQLTEWTEELHRGLAEDSQAIQKLQLELSGAAHALGEFERRIRAEVHAANERIRQLLKDSLEIISSAESGCESFSATVLAARLRASQQSERFCLGVGQTVEELTSKTDTAQKHLKTLAEDVSGHVGLVADSAMNNTTTALENFERSVLQVPQNAALESRRVAEALKGVDQLVQEHVRRVTVSGQSFQEVATATAPMYHSLTQIPTELQAVLMTARVI